MGIGSDIGGIAEAGQFLSGLVSNTGTRMSDEHFREGIARSNLFLEGTTPTNAAMYNQYQNATYGEDTARMAQRAKDLGMSNWELLGKGATSPVQSFGDQKAGDTQFLSQQMPLKIAEMQARTQLANTFLQTQTQKDINNQNTVQGKLPEQQRIESAARTVAANASAERDWQNITLDMARTLMEAAPKETVEVGPYRREAKTGMTTVRNFLSQMRDVDGSQPISTAVAGLNTDTAEQVMRGLKEMASNLLDSGPSFAKGVDKAAGEAGKAIQGAMDNAGKFLNSLTNKKK